MLFAGRSSGAVRTKRKSVELDCELHPPRFIYVNQRKLTRTELVCRGDYHHHLPRVFGEVDDVTLIPVGGRVGVVGVLVVCWRAGVVVKRQKSTTVVSVPNAGFADGYRSFEGKGEHMLTRKSGSHLGVQACHSFEKKGRESCDVGRLWKFTDVLQPFIVLIIRETVYHCLMSDQPALIRCRENTSWLIT